MRQNREGKEVSKCQAEGRMSCFRKPVLLVPTKLPSENPGEGGKPWHVKTAPSLERHVCLAGTAGFLLEVLF